MSFLNSSSRPHGVSESVWASIHCIVHIDSHSALLGTDVQQFLTKGPSVISHHLSHIFFIWQCGLCFSKEPFANAFGKKSFITFVLASCLWLNSERTLSLPPHDLCDDQRHFFWVLIQTSVSQITLFWESIFPPPPPYAGGSHGPGNAASIALAWGAALPSPWSENHVTKASMEREYFFVPWFCCSVSKTVCFCHCNITCWKVRSYNPQSQILFCLHSMYDSSDIGFQQHSVLLSRVSGTEEEPCANRRYVAFMEWGHDTRAVTLHSASLQVREQCIYEYPREGGQNGIETCSITPDVIQ